MFFEIKRAFDSYLSFALPTRSLVIFAGGDYSAPIRLIPNYKPDIITLVAKRLSICIHYLYMPRCTLSSSLVVEEQYSYKMSPDPHTQSGMRARDTLMHT